MSHHGSSRLKFYRGSRCFPLQPFPVCQHQLTKTVVEASPFLIIIHSSFFFLASERVHFKRRLRGPAGWALRCGHLCVSVFVWEKKNGWQVAERNTKQCCMIHEAPHEKFNIPQPRQSLCHVLSYNCWTQKLEFCVFLFLHFIFLCIHIEGEKKKHHSIDSSSRRILTPVQRCWVSFRSLWSACAVEQGGRTCGRQLGCWSRRKCFRTLKLLAIDSPATRRRGSAVGSGRVESPRLIHTSNTLLPENKPV